MPLPPRRSQPASAPRPGFQVPRKTTRHFSPFEERREVEAMDKARSVVVVARSAGSGGSLVEREKQEMGLERLMELSKGRAPRTPIAQSLGFDVIPPLTPTIALPNTPFPSSVPNPTTRTRPSFLTASASLLTASLGLSKTPELSHSSGTARLSPPTAVAKAEEESWERVPSFKAGGGMEEPWVGIEDDEDEDLMFWDEKDERELVGGGKGAATEVEVEGKAKATLSYARVLKG